MKAIDETGYIKRNYKKEPVKLPCYLMSYSDTTEESEV